MKNHVRNEQIVDVPDAGVDNAVLFNKACVKFLVSRGLYVKFNPYIHQVRKTKPKPA